MANWIIVGILLVTIGAAGIYLIRARKKGQKCIGCPACGHCNICREK